MTGLLIAIIVCVILLVIGIIFKWEEFNLLFIAFGLWFAFIYFCNKYNESHPKTPHSNYGIVVGKEAEPAGMDLNIWTLRFEYMPDRYKLILEMEDGRRVTKRIDGVGYQQTNIGDKVKYY